VVNALTQLPNSWFI